MNSLSNVSIIRKTLLDWYVDNQRDLPWRHMTDPYKIWLSEIILQQTRIEQGLSYYERFVTNFPDVRALADAPLTEVLKCWQGLGYYSRARNLHTTARQLVNDFQGQFPASYDELLKLKGIGAYTAAAIASFSFQLPHAVLDGNVFRILARLFLIETPIHTTAGKKQFTVLAGQLLDPLHPDTYNQAIMDFGALQCTPANPDCGHCPLCWQCMAYKQDCVATLPVRKTETTKRNRYFYYIACHDEKHTWLHERMGKDIWQHLWEFPLVETTEETTLENLLKRPDVSSWTGQVSILQKPVSFRHILSHQIIHATFIPVQVADSRQLNADYVRVTLDRLELYPVSRLIDLFLSEHYFI